MEKKCNKCDTQRYLREGVHDDYPGVPQGGNSSAKTGWEFYAVGSELLTLRKDFPVYLADKSPRDLWFNNNHYIIQGPGIVLIHEEHIYVLPLEQKYVVVPHKLQ